MNDRHVYDDNALGSLRRLGRTHVELWCLGSSGGKPCGHRDRLAIDRLIAACGPATTLLMIARRARCRDCGTRGCHVQPAPGPERGQPGYETWLRVQVELAYELIARETGLG